MSSHPVVLAKFESNSRPGTFHEVRVGADGNTYCTCASWRFQRNSPTNRTCKHIESWKARTVVGGVSLAERLGPGPVAVRAPRKSRKAAPKVVPTVSVSVHGRHATIPCPPPAGCEGSDEPAYRPTSWERL